MKKIKLQTTFLKFFASNLIIIFLLAGLILIFSFKTLRSFYLSQLQDSLNQLAISLSDKFIPYLESKNNRAIDRIAKSYGKKLNVRITVISPNGIVLGDSERDPKDMENHANRPEIKEALKKGMGTALRFSATLQKYMLYLAISVPQGKKTLGVIRVSLFVEKIKQLLGKLKKQMVNLVLLISLFASLLAIVLSQTFTRPIYKLVKAVSLIANGDLKTRIHLKDKDELGILAKHLNNMASQLETAFKELSLEREELKAIMDGLQGILVVLDMDGKILLHNENFKKITGTDSSIKGKYYWEVLRESNLNNFLKELRNRPTSCLKEIPIKKEYYLCSATYMPQSKRLVLIFHDITPLKEIERVKKDLVANVSHELKTPLTAVQGYVEVLLDEEKDSKKKQYLDIIDRNTKRICNIINDLLSLSALETKKELDLEEIYLKELMGKLKDLFSTQLKKKALKFTYKIYPDAEKLIGDRIKLEHLFINLLDNAIKYTEKGEISISVKPHSKKHFLRITVSDTGIGIPEEHIPYIFERFYVVDKSRSRRTGGTGLGLSIVKHIVNLHKGSIKVQSDVGKGTKFIIDLPEVPNTLTEKS